MLFEIQRRRHDLSHRLTLLVTELKKEDCFRSREHFTTITILLLAIDNRMYFEGSRSFLDLTILLLMYTSNLCASNDGCGKVLAVEYYFIVKPIA